MYGRWKTHIKLSIIITFNTTNMAPKNCIVSRYNSIRAQNSGATNANQL